MRSDFAAAAKFYEQVAQSGAKPLGNGMEPRPAPDGPSFSDFLKQAGTDTVNELKQGEAQSIQGLAGKAELSDVIAAVSQAEVSLQTVVAVRETVFVTLKLGAPILLLALVAGVAISLLQALTQMQEMTLSFVPKILAILLSLIIFLPFMLTTLTDFTHELMDRIASGG